MIQMVELLKPYKCKKCGQEMLFFLTKNNTLIDYKALMVDYSYTLMDIKKYLEDKNICFIKCLSCNKTYIIDWTDGYPVPLIDETILNKFRV